MSNRVCFLESCSGVETLFIRGLRTGAEQNGWQISVVFLRDKSGNPFSIQDIQKSISRQSPDIICFLMDAPLPFQGILDGLEQIPKKSVWFDDFLRSPHTLGGWQRWRDWQANQNVCVHIWDGYWRQRWEAQTGQAALPLHLAANAVQFDPYAEPLYPELAEFAVMTGTIPSLESLLRETAALPLAVQALLKKTTTLLESQSWPIRPYESVLEQVEQLPEKHRASVQAWLDKPAQRAVFHHQVWRWGKRIVRLRGLKTAAKVGPVAVLSGHRTEEFASKEEIRSLLPENAVFEFRDTTNVKAGDWSRIFRTGKVQLQFTDPQSIEGGIPFRVFECAASCATLLSDERPELSEILPESWTFRNEADLAQTLAHVPGDLSERTKAVHQKFLENHTWEKRWREIAGA